MHTEGYELMEWLVWVALFTVGVTFQLVSVAQQRQWGMLTSSVRWLRVRLWGRLVIFPAWFWLTWHWFMEPRSLGGGQFWDDAAAITLGVLAAIYVDYQDHVRTMSLHQIPDESVKDEQ
jgi:hypothetical protein